MILSYTKPFNEKMRKQLVQIWEKKKKHVSSFSTLSTDDMKTKKKQISFVGIKILNNSQKATIFTQQAFNFFKKRPQHRCFYAKYPKILRTLFLQNTCGYFDILISFV